MGLFVVEGLANASYGINVKRGVLKNALRAQLGHGTRHEDM